MRSGRLGSESPQTLAGTDRNGGFLSIHCAGVRMTAYAKMLARAAAVLIADVTFADIARNDEDFLGRMEKP